MVALGEQHPMSTDNWVTSTFKKKTFIGMGNQVTGSVPVPRFQDLTPDLVVAGSWILELVPDPVQPSLGMDLAGVNRVQI